jgi:adenylate cyclase
MWERILTSQVMHLVLLLALLCVSITFSFSHARWREQIRNFTFDNYNIVKPREASDNIIIVDIDEASLARIGQMPWPRTVMAELVNKLKEMGAAVIVFDIVFVEADRSSPWAVAQAFKNKEGFADIEERFKNLPDNDALFGLAIGEAGNVVTGFSFTNERTDMTPVQKGIFRGKNLEKFAPNLSGASANIKTVDRFAAGNGSFFVSTDTDGIIRRVPMLIAHHKENSNIISIYPSLALETIRVLEKEKGGKVVLGDARYAELDPSRFGIEGIEIGKDKRVIPTNARGEFQVYFAKSNPAWYLSALQILDGIAPPERIKDKIVFVGTSAVGLKDIRSTPLDTFIPGVEVHLNIVDQILQGQYLNRSIEAEGLEAISILAIGLLIIVFSRFLGAFAQALFVTVIVAAAIYGGWYAFSVHGMLIDVTYPSFAILSIFMLSTVLTYLRTEKERQAVRQAFGLYISPDFMKELTENPEKLRLGGEIRDLSVMFTDIRKFTSISEGLAPEELIQLINDFLTPMSDLVMQNRGTIDKYMGDAMMAFWNAPLDDPDHARNACTAALGMQAALEPINAQIKARAKAGKEPVLLNAGIGINTGPCAVGNMGSKQRFAYSTLGDAVNTASRLEGQTKTYGVNILLGEETWKKVRDFAVLELDLLKVQGKNEKLRIFTLLGNSEIANTPAFRQWRETHEQMIASYRGRDFDKAFKLAKKCLELSQDKLDVVYAMYQERAVEFMARPPAADWDGVYEAKTK